MKRFFTVLATLLAMNAALADDDGVPRRGPSGLSVYANAGVIWADGVNANFYSGRPENVNTIDRVLYSNSYGTQIWNELKSAGLIDGTIANYNQLNVEEYANMYCWLLRFDLLRLRANGVFNLGSTTGTGILTNNHRYIPCDIMGLEDRIHIDLAITRTVYLGGNICLELDLGATLNNTKVRENKMKIASSTYSILDVWNGNTPDVGVGSYEYVNQGGIGWGVFMSGLVGYGIRGIGAIKAGYTCYHSRTNLIGYDSMGWQHSIFVRFEINNFSFL